MTIKVFVEKILKPHSKFLFVTVNTLLLQKLAINVIFAEFIF